MSNTVVCAPSLAKITGSHPPPAARPRTRAPSSFTPFSRPRGSMKRRMPAFVFGGRPKGRVEFIPAFASRSHMDRLCSAILSFIAWASYRIAGFSPAGNDLARGLAPGDRVCHYLSMRSKQTLKSTPTGAIRTKRRPQARPRLRAAQPTGPTGSATRDRLVEAALTTLRTRGFPGTTPRAIGRTGQLHHALLFYH